MIYRNKEEDIMIDAIDDKVSFDTIQIPCPHDHKSYAKMMQGYVKKKVCVAVVCINCAMRFQCSSLEIIARRAGRGEVERSIREAILEYFPVNFFMNAFKEKKRTTNTLYDFSGFLNELLEDTPPDDNPLKDMAYERLVGIYPGINQIIDKTKWRIIYTIGCDRGSLFRSIVSLFTIQKMNLKNGTNWKLSIEDREILSFFDLYKTIFIRWLMNGGGSVNKKTLKVLSTSQKTVLRAQKTTKSIKEIAEKTGMNIRKTRRIIKKINSI